MGTTAIDAGDDSVEDPLVAPDDEAIPAAAHEASPSDDGAEDSVTYQSDSATPESKI